MTREQFLQLWPNSTESTLRANGFAPLGAVGAKEHKPQPRTALVKDVSPGSSRTVGLGVVVTIIACRNTVCDADNSRAGYKPLQDAISRSLAIDDGSERIRFEYGQVVSASSEGTIVRIEWL